MAIALNACRDRNPGEQEMDILELARSHRAAIVAEIGRLDAFLDRAEALFRGNQGIGAPALCPAPVASNVIPLRRPLSRGYRDATACGTGE